LNIKYVTTVNHEVEMCGCKLMSSSDSKAYMEQTDGFLKFFKTNSADEYLNLCL